jgi:hypothetical protein
MTLPELADRLEDLDGRRTPVGWSPEDAVERAHVERCILGLISGDSDEAHALRCELEIRLRSKEKASKAVVRGLGGGGVLVDTDDQWAVGTHVEMQVRGDGSDEHGLRARGIVAGLDGGVAKISVAEQPSEAHERRLRRFVLELIRHRFHD